MATTLLDDERYSKDDIPELYHHRWCVYMDFGDIKYIIMMDVLRGRTPEMRRREVWAHLLARNLVRQVMAQAARQKRPPGTTRASG